MYSRETCETSVDFDLLEEIAEREYEERCERETLEEQCYRECKASYEELKRSWS